VLLQFQRVHKLAAKVNAKELRERGQVAHNVLGEQKEQLNRQVRLVKVAELAHRHHVAHGKGAVRINARHVAKRAETAKGATQRQCRVRRQRQVKQHTIVFGAPANCTQVPVGRRD
jgi:hypothetical protein